MKANTGIDVCRVDFSDPQGGKGACDRKAATIKAHVRRYVNEGHDVQNAEQLQQLSCLMEVSPGFALLLLMLPFLPVNCLRSNLMVSAR